MVFREVTQSSKEIRTHTLDFTNDLPSGVTVSSAALAHTGPTSETPTSSVTSPNVAVTLDTPGVGVHYVSVLATLSNSEKAHGLLRVIVNF